jgi:hypothetical protein
MQSGGGGESVAGGANRCSPLVCTILMHLTTSTTVYVNFHMATLQRNTMSLRT